MRRGNRAVPFVPRPRTAGAQVSRKQGKTEMFMNCREYRNSLMEWARGNPPAPEAISHLEVCHLCARFLEEQRALSAAMARLATEPAPPAEQFQARVMAEFDKVQVARKPLLRWILAGALAASVIRSEEHT